MTVTEPAIGAVVVAIARTGGLALTAPVIGDSGVSLRARLVLVLAVGMAVGANRDGVAFADLPPLVALELALGLLTGLSARFILARVATAGQLMGLSLGLGFASQYDVHAGESAGTIRTLLSTLAGLAFLAAGGLESIVRSVAAPAHVAQLATLGPTLMREGTAAMAQGLTLAAPILLASLIGNIGLAVMNRAAPAINIFSMAFAAVLLLGGIVLLSTAGDLVMGINDDARDAASALHPTGVSMSDAAVQL